MVGFHFFKFIVCFFAVFGNAIRAISFLTFINFSFFVICKRTYIKVFFVVGKQIFINSRMLCHIVVLH